MLRMLNDVEAKLYKYTKDDKGYEITLGSNPVVFSAPHSVEHTRDYKLLPSESFTASIVETLAYSLKCSSIYKTINKFDDANFDKNNYYKDKTLELCSITGCKVFIDFHIMGEKNPTDFEIGTFDGKHLKGRSDILDILRRELLKVGSVSIDRRFKASNPNTMCSFISTHLDIVCIQVEINYKLIKGNSSKDRVMTYGCFQNAVKNILSII